MIGREFDLEGLYTAPEDGNRCEILDGALVMTPGPTTDHQNVLTRLVVLLDECDHPFAARVVPVELTV